jgi:hypothetical protein
VRWVWSRLWSFRVRNPAEPSEPRGLVRLAQRKRQWRTASRGRARVRRRAADVRRMSADRTPCRRGRRARATTLCSRGASAAASPTHWPPGVKTALIRCSPRSGRSSVSHSYPGCCVGARAACQRGDLNGCIRLRLGPSSLVCECGPAFWRLLDGADGGAFEAADHSDDP